MCGKVNLTTIDGEVRLFDRVKQKGNVWIRKENKSFSFSGHCFYGTSSMPTPINGKSVLVVRSSSSEEVVFVFPPR